ncbi:MAG: phenylalanine--tRNA ligase subunit beta [Hyphomicrobium sp.]|uniref:phenylalanine--tRNA ligase subunit beta n=1 Tax=Hyphomicrobium sp. TaxID=82 RepID=UPI001324304C|nr:phenylalanine--tRNA ligase subunit beta [Hyphomicrobium sp.]KAB2938957.1 MAG: phenylalanine--tRNA ligase subunit beta [Hyphomicrobium sp.]MBZ0208729.1 phenylalanine--tRNA ligase subunit beta [Hyphomicrobium sp.]
MKFTLSWLKDHLDTDASLEALEAKLSAIGLEVESIDNPAAKLAAFTIARVLEAKQHPNADRLRVVQVEIAKGKPPVEVVCGAPNARAGMVAVFAPLGTYIPGSGITLEKKPVRGIVSNGMLVSERELELSDAHEGIIELPPDMASSVGEKYAEAMGLADPVIEVKLTPNRPDCTGVRGIARDLAAAGLGKLKPEPQIEGVEGEFDSPVNIKLEFSKDTADACPVFAGRYVRGVKNGPSPAWLQQRLKAVGLRPINALVDVTNYISQDRGRPLHVYDADKLKGAVRARLGKAGEKLLALDGKEYAVDETMCVIADDNGPLGLGGVIGGEASGSTDATVNVLIECAYFDPARTAATGRKTGLVTDARYRFERGVDPASVLPGLDLATDMILQLADGEPSKAKVAGKPPVEKRVIDFDYARVGKLTGLEIKDAEIKAVLERLGCTVTGKGKSAKVAVPTWRPDIHGVADLVEEVVRIAGLERVPATPMPRPAGVARPVLTERQKRARRARRTLAARGLVEAITWSFVPAAEAKAFGGGAAALELANPISVEMSSMRPGLLPGLLAALKRNRNRGFSDAALFELGQAYRGEKADDQYLSASGVRSGTAKVGGSGRYWDGVAREVDVFDAKADVFAVLIALGLDPAKAQITRDAPAWYHPGRSGTLRLGPKTVLAHFGELHPATLRELDVAPPVAALEIFLDALPAQKAKSRAKPRLEANDLLPVRRDFAFVLDRGVPAGDVVRAAASADKALIREVSVFDVFEGGALEKEGKKSLAIEVTLQPTAETLTDKEIEAVAQKVAAAVKAATGGEIRS